MIARTVCLVSIFLFFFSPKKAVAQLHPYETLGRVIFDSFRNHNFDSYYARSIFTLKEAEFKSFLFNIRNQDIRNELMALHRQPYPEDLISASSKWEIAFKHNWRTQWRHLSSYSPNLVWEQSFRPIILRAEEYDIQWETAKLLAIEVSIPVTWKNGRFEVKSDADLDQYSPDRRTLYLDRNLDYRFQPDKNTYSKALMIGTDPEDSDMAYKRNIKGNGAGEGELLVRFDQSTPNEMFYFCPDQEGAGGKIVVSDFENPQKANQRTDLILTFSYGYPKKIFQIMIKEVILTPKGPLFCEKSEWIGETILPRGLSSE